MVRAVVGAALAAMLGGCAAAGSSTVTTPGKTLTIYASVPGQDPPSQDVFDAEQLAFNQPGAQPSSYQVKFVRLTAAKLSNNARTAIEDKHAIAYLGELAPGASAQSMGILNAQDVLQVSPTDTVLEPDSYYESYSTYGRTFARVVPSTTLEAKAQATEMRSLGVKRLVVTSDGSSYGSTIAAAVRTAVAAAGITLAQSQSGADAMFYGGGSATTAASAFNHAAATNAQLKLFGPSALENTAFATALSGAERVYISAPGFLPTKQQAAGRAFDRAFKQAYGHSPSPQSIFGYEAMSAVLAVLRGAGSSANNRSTVVKNFFGQKRSACASLSISCSMVGPYSIDAHGDTSAGPFVFSRLAAGNLVPYKFVQVGG